MLQDDCASNSGLSDAGAKFILSHLDGCARRLEGGNDCYKQRI
jgi:hypothetical protein